MEQKVITFCSSDFVHMLVSIVSLSKVKRGNNWKSWKFSRNIFLSSIFSGYSKSAGYQPGVKFQDSRFRNSWNAVYVAGAWRFVQCNWGARHLVNAKEVPKSSKGKNDSLRYEYDDHYFLTDPREFIYEFFPLQEEWQLLKRPISLKEFENLPFVRSLFFRYGLHFADEGYGAVVFTDDTGAATVRIAM